MGRKYTEEELKSCSKEMLVSLLLSMQDQLEKVNANMEHLIEQIAVMNNQRFGRKTEKLAEIAGQYSLFDFKELYVGVPYRSF